MKIINEPCLPYKVIGQVIDDYMDMGAGNTCYYGKIDDFIIDYKDKLYKVLVRYLKSYVEWRFCDYEEE